MNRHIAIAIVLVLASRVFGEECTDDGICPMPAAADQSNYEVLSPVPGSAVEHIAPAPRLDTLAGKTIALVGGSFMASVTHPELKRLILAEYPTARIILLDEIGSADLKYRPPYGKAYSSHRRYASFIGTTNEPMPLVDTTGSRRFICVQVEGNIDFETPIEYAQLYAQLKYEVEVLCERYYLTKEEEVALMEHNLNYQKMSGLGEMLMSLFEKPEASPDEDAADGMWLSVKEISARLKQSFKGIYQPDEGTFIKIGQFLSRPEYKFESERKTSGCVYWVKERA